MAYSSLDIYISRVIIHDHSTGICKVPQPAPLAPGAHLVAPYNWLLRLWCHGKPLGNTQGTQGLWKMTW